MRRSPRRSAAQQTAAARLNYNDSDTGSAASLSQEPMSSSMMGSSRAQRAYRLQMHGGSEQDTGLMYAGHRGRPGTALLIEQHRRHQSADAGSGTNRQPSRNMMGYYEEIAGAEEDDGEFGPPLNQEDSSMATPAGASKPKLMVGSSPPPMIGPLEEEFASDSGQERNGEPTTSIRVASNQDDGDDVASGAGGGVAKKQQSPVRFIAPKVAPLNSPSSPLIPDEELIPPDVPYRGRRLPQIPGSGIIKTAADFLHSSIYGGGRHHQTVGVAAAAAGAPIMVAGAPVAAGGPQAHYMGDMLAGYEHPTAPGGDMTAAVFPLVSESPTTLEPPGADARAIQRQQTIALGSIGAVGKPALVGDVPMGSSFEGSSSINFPRVSFSPTHLPPSTTATTTGGVRYHSVSQASAGPSAASVIATSHPSAGGATQSTVLGPVVSVASEAGGSGMLPAGDRGWTLSRRAIKKEDEDDWF